MLFTRLFPLWAILACMLALSVPDWFTALQGLIVPLLAVVMFAMGLTLGPADFRRVMQTPRPIAIGVTLQFLLMPLIALLLSRMLQLSPDLTAGMVVVGACAGGTASNVICYLGKGDVALSISMTLMSTLLGVLLTPLLCALYLSSTVQVDTAAMLMNILQVVLLPIAGGLLINQLARPLVKKIEPGLPLVAMVMILLIISIIVALNAGRLPEAGLITLAAVILHNSFGLAGGFYISRLLGMDPVRARTIAIEVGMQNSGLGVALSLEFFSATAALPGALFSIWHNISGSLLAARWAAGSDAGDTPATSRPGRPSDQDHM